MPYFYDFAEPGSFGVPNQFFRDTGTDPFEAYKTGTIVIPIYEET
jgi:hypothetical protein